MRAILLPDLALVERTDAVYGVDTVLAGRIEAEFGTERIRSR